MAGTRPVLGSVRDGEKSQRREKDRKKEKKESDISQREPLIPWSRLRMRNTRMYGLLFQSQNSKTISNMFRYNINALCAYTLRVQNTFCVFIVFKWNPKFQGRIYTQDGQRGVLPGQWTPLIAAPIRRSISSILHPPPLSGIFWHISTLIWVCYNNLIFSIKWRIMTI